MSQKYTFPDFVAAGNRIKEIIRTQAGVESVKFFKDSFVKEGFTDVAFTAWDKTSGPMAGKRTLYKSGNLMRSIHVSESSDNRVVVASDTDYSGIHNEGGTIVVTPQMKKYFWAMYYKSGGGKSKAALNSRALWFRRLALKKVGSVIKIPKRQFMRESKTHMDNLQRIFADTVVREFQQLK